MEFSTGGITEALKELQDLGYFGFQISALGMPSLSLLLQPPKV
jgi:hypothetical protein